MPTDEAFLNAHALHCTRHISIPCKARCQLASQVQGLHAVVVGKLGNAGQCFEEEEERVEVDLRQFGHDGQSIMRRAGCCQKLRKQPVWWFWRCIHTSDV